MTTKRAPIAAKNTAEAKTVKDDFVTEVGGVEVRLPSLTFLPVGAVRKIRNLGQTDAAFTLIEDALSEDALAEVDKMDPDEFDGLMQAWRDHSGVSLGES